MVIDGSHFDEPTPTPNALSGPIAFVAGNDNAIMIILKTNVAIIFQWKSSKSPQKNSNEHQFYLNFVTTALFHQTTNYKIMFHSDDAFYFIRKLRPH